MLTFCFSFQVSHKLGVLDISREACTVLWDHFVAAKIPTVEEVLTSNCRIDYTLTTYYLDQDIALGSSPVLLRHVLSSVFVAVETAVREKDIFCNKFCDNGPLYEGT